MRLVLGFAAIALSAPLLFTAATASAAPKEVHYDCSKAGNANKAACKGAAPAVAAAKPVAAAPVVTAAAAPKEMHYDCSKAGNANKAACKGATPVVATAPAKPATATPVAVTKPAMAARPTMAVASRAPAAASSGRVVAYTEKNGKTVHFDCSKAGNFNKTACKS